MLTLMTHACTHTHAHTHTHTHTNTNSLPQSLIPSPLPLTAFCAAALSQFEACFDRSAPASIVVSRFLEDEQKAFKLVEQAAKQDALLVYTLVRARAAGVHASWAAGVYACWAASAHICWAAGVRAGVLRLHALGGGLQCF